jgi:hypothetical protein
MHILIECAPLRRYQSRRDRKEQLDDVSAILCIGVLVAR